MATVTVLGTQPIFAVRTAACALGEDAVHGPLPCAAMQRSAQVAAPARLRVRRLAPPSSLAVLLVIVLSVGLSWALVVPPWQSPDELAHFGFVQSLAENFAILPTLPAHRRPRATSAPPTTPSEPSRGAFWPTPAPPDWRRSDYDAYLAAEHVAHPPSRSDGTGPSTATNNPPLYYLVAAAAYLVDHGGTAFGRRYSIRIFGVLLLIVTTIAAWLLAGEVFGRRRLAQLGCAAVAGLLPMATFMSTAVNPDALVITCWTLTLWLGARVINHRAQAWDAVWLCAATAAAILTKATSYALVGPILVALLIGWLRRPAAERRRALVFIVAAGLVLALPVLGWFALASHVGGLSITTVGSSPAHPFLISQFLSYVWQFYLPRLPFLTPFRTTPDLPVYDVWIRQLTGVFGWLDVYLPDWLYRVAAVAAAGLGLGSIALLTRLRDRRHLALLAFFAVTLLALLVVLHVTEYRALIAGGGVFLQGRYLLPVVSLFGLAVGLVMRAGLRPASCPSACGAGAHRVARHAGDLAVHRRARLLPVRRSGLPTTRRWVLLPAVGGRGPHRARRSAHRRFPEPVGAHRSPPTRPTSSPSPRSVPARPCARARSPATEPARSLVGIWGARRRGNRAADGHGTRCRHAGDRSPPARFRRLRRRANGPPGSTETCPEVIRSRSA